MVGDVRPVPVGDGADDRQRDGVQGIPNA